MKKTLSTTSVETIIVQIRGRVQGVGFRAAAVRQAHELGITGWVRNTDDGAVEALLQGHVDAIDRMLSWLHTGPPAARVDEVSSREDITDRLFDRFQQV